MPHKHHVLVECFMSKSFSVLADSPEDAEKQAREIVKKNPEGFKIDRVGFTVKKAQP